MFLKRFVKSLFIILLAGASSVNYNIFVFPNKFAPAGIDGICTMIQDISGINIGYLSFILNIPLIIIAFIFLNREFALNTTLYIVSFSVCSVLLKLTPISDFVYYTDTGTSTVLAPLSAGVIRGILYAVTLKQNASSGGVDIISATVKKLIPHLDLMTIIFMFNMTVAFSSYFVYGFKLEPVILSIIYSFTTSSVSSKLRLKENETVKFEIITSEFENLCNEISIKLKQTATIMDAKGAYSGANKKIVICVTEKEKVPVLEDLILKFPDCVVFKSTTYNNISGTSYK